MWKRKEFFVFFHHCPLGNIHTIITFTMERIFEYQITAKENGNTLLSFLRANGYSRHILAQLKKEPDSILLNGEVRFASTILKEGDRITVHLAEEASSPIPPVKLPFSIVYEDPDLLVVNKPADMPIHPSVNNHGNTLANALAFHYQEQGKKFVFRCINRLDRDTSGLLVLAKNALSGALLSDMSAKHALNRQYLAIVKGKTPPSGSISAPIGRRAGSVLMRCVDFEHGQSAVTHYERLDYRKGLSLLRVRLSTGRTHQIRVHLGFLGYPLIGDFLYYPDMERITRQALHSHQLSFLHPITGEVLCLTAPLPPDMEQAFYG